MKKEPKDYHFFMEYDSVYSSVPDYLKLPSVSKKIVYIKMEEIKKWFLNHKGKRNAVPLNKIARELKFSPSGNSVGFRHLCEFLIEKQYFPILSCPKGYFYAETIEEMRETKFSLINKQKGISRHIKALEFMIVKEYNDNGIGSGQSTMDDFMGEK